MSLHETQILSGFAELRRQWPWLRTFKTEVNELERCVYCLAGTEPVTELAFLVTAVVNQNVVDWRLYTPLLKWTTPPTPPTTYSHEELCARYGFIKTNGEPVHSVPNTTILSVSDMIKSCQFPEDVHIGIAHVRSTFDAPGATQTLTEGPRQWAVAFELTHVLYIVSIRYLTEHEQNLEYMRAVNRPREPTDRRSYEQFAQDTRKLFTRPLWTLRMFNGPEAPLFAAQGVDAALHLMARIDLLQRSFVTVNSPAELAALQEGYAYEERPDKSRMYNDDDDDDDDMDTESGGGGDYCDRHRRVPAARRNIDPDDVIMEDV